MNKLFFLLLSAGFILANAQTKTKSVTLTPQQQAAMKTKVAAAYPNSKPAVTKPQMQVNPVPTKGTPSASTQKPKAPVKSSESTATTTAAASTAKPFTFLGTFNLNYLQKDEKRSYEGKIKYAFDGFSGAIVPNFPNMKEISNMRAVINKKDEEITMLTTDVKARKNGLLMKLPKPVIKTTDTKTPVKPAVIKKTGETKVIQGYKCEKVVALLADSTKIESWVTATPGELTINVADVIAMTNQGFRGKSPFSETNMKDIKGTALETLITNKDKSTMQITISDIKKVKPEAALFSDDGYNVKDVRGLPMFGGQ